MKRRLNIICILMFITLCTSLVHGLLGGIQGATDAIENSSDEVTGYYSAQIQPVNLANYPDSVFNSKDQCWMKASVNRIIIEKPITKVEKSSLIFELIVLLSFIIVSIFCIYHFIKLIININRSQIFEWKNVHHLRVLGISLLLLFIINLTVKYYELTDFAQSIALEGYEIDWAYIYDVPYIVLGLASLIFAEIFSIGLKLKEDQELTI